MPVAAPFADVPVNRWFGFRLVARSAERAELELPLRPDFLQEAGVVQGGVLTALADSAAVYVLWPDLPPDRSMIGTGCTMAFLAAATPDRGPLRAIAVPLRRGSRMAVCESEVWQGERLVAKGTFPFLFLPRNPQ